MAKTIKTSKGINNDALLQRFLLDNLKSIIEIFKKVVGSLNIEEINKHIAKIKQQLDNLNKEKDRINQDYRKVFFNNQNGDISPVSEDNNVISDYTERYQKILNTEQLLQNDLNEQYILLEQANTLKLLNLLFQKQLEIGEIQEVIEWRRSQAYASINRYEQDDDTDTNNDEIKLQKIQEDLNNLCKKCLANPEIQKLLHIVIAENNKKRAQKQGLHTRQY